MVLLQTARQFLQNHPAIYDSMRTVRNTVRGRVYRAESAMRMFEPHSICSRSTFFELTLKAVYQTVPLLADVAAAYGDKSAIETSAEDFWKTAGQNAAVDVLAKLFTAYGSDKSMDHDYHYIYGAILADREKIQNILEIGLGTNNTDIASHMSESGKPGGSLRAFRDFLPNARVFGADLDRKILFQEERISTFFVDQTDISTFSSLERLALKFDLIIDDGLHSPNANLAVLLFGLQRLAAGGWLVVEDISELTLPIWKVVASILPSNLYKCYIISAKNGFVFVVHYRGSSPSSLRAELDLTYPSNARVGACAHKKRDTPRSL